MGWHGCKSAQTTNVWVVYDLGKPSYISKITYQGYKPSNAHTGNSMPKDFRIEYCTNMNTAKGCSWIVGSRLKGTNAKHAALQTIALSKPIKRTRFIRMFYENAHNPSQGYLII